MYVRAKYDFWLGAMIFITGLATIAIGGLLGYTGADLAKEAKNEGISDRTVSLLMPCGFSRRFFNF